MKEHKCSCGVVTNLESFYEAAEDGARDDGYDYDLNGEFTCEGCGSEFDINLYASVEINVSFMDIQCTYASEVQVHGIPILDLTIGDQVLLDDGRYEACNKIYVIEGNVLQAIFNSESDDNQMTLSI